MNKNIIFLIYFISIFLFFSLQLWAQEADQIKSINQIHNEPQKRVDFHRFSDKFKFLNRASEPTKFFFAPTSRILKSLEVMIITGGFFGVEENGALFNHIGIGLGNIAEVEFSSSNISNKLTGESSTLPTSVFKVGLIPERYTRLWYVPQMSLQLRSTPWRSVAEQHSKLLAENKTSYLGKNLNRLNVTSRFTTLYFVTGKDGASGGLHFGLSLMDVRTQQGRQWLYDEVHFDYIDVKIPEMKKEILAPFGGMYIRANPQTWLMAEIEPIPCFGYDVKNRTVHIRRAWLGIGGIRFFIGNWLSLDTGVKYQSDFDGIADAEINIGLNMMIPFKKAT